MQPVQTQPSFVHCPVLMEDGTCHTVRGILSARPDITNRPDPFTRPDDHTEQLIASLVEDIKNFRRDNTRKVDNVSTRNYVQTTHSKRDEPFRSYLIFGDTLRYATGYLKHRVLEALQRADILNNALYMERIEVHGDKPANGKGNRTPDCLIQFQSYNTKSYIIQSYKDCVCYYD